MKHMKQQQKKICKECGSLKKLEEFHREPANSDGRKGKCNVCCNAKTARWHAAHPEYQRRRRLQSIYGITLEQYDEILAAQSGCCACCGTSDPGGRNSRFHVDHDHETKQIRGLLCHNCNRGIGWLGDTLESVVKAVEYLTRAHERV